MTQSDPLENIFNQYNDRFQANNHPVKNLKEIDNYGYPFTKQKYINDAILALYKTYHHNIAVTGPKGCMPEQALQKIITTMRESRIVNRSFYWTTLDKLQQDISINQALTNSKNTIYLYIIDFDSIIKNSIANTIVSELNVFLTENPQVQLMVTGGTDLATWIKSSPTADNMFTNIEIQEPNDQDLATDLLASASSFTNSKKTKLNKEIVDYTIRLSHQYFHQQVNPGASISIIDQALADLRVFKFGNKITKKILNFAVEQMLGISVESINSPVTTITNNLNQKVFGQKKAITQIAQGLSAGQLGIRNPNRPLYSCLCFGSTGIGKTLLAQTISDTLYGNESHLFTLDMSSYADERLGPTRLLGSPVGYEGHELGGLLTSTVSEYPQSVILLDEFEKAAPTVQQIFLQILDQGYLRDNKNNHIDFTHTIIIATSNAGQDVHHVGFAQTGNKTKTELIKQLKDDFSPELLNRFDNIIEFKDLTKIDLGKIFDSVTQQFINRVTLRGLSFKMTPTKLKNLRKTVTTETTNGRQAQLLTNQLLEQELQKQMMNKNELARA